MEFILPLYKKTNASKAEKSNVREVGRGAVVSEVSVSIDSAVVAACTHTQWKDSLLECGVAIAWW